MVQLGYDSDEEGLIPDSPTQKFFLRKPICPYVTSTPVDFKDERTFLAEKIFPELHELCQQRGTSFSPIDLQWKPDSFQTATGHLLRTNLDYIQKCSPFFICLLGETYGPYRDPESPKLPARISDLPEDPPWLDYNYLVAASAGYTWVAKEGNQNCSLPELEIIQAAFLSDNRFCHFYYRQPEHLDHRFPGKSEKERADSARLYKPEDEYGDLHIRDLKQRIVNKGLPVKYFQTNDELGKLVLTDWLCIINTIYPPLDITTPFADSEEKREWLYHESFAESRRHPYITFPALRALEANLSEICAAAVDEPFLEAEEPSRKYRAYSITNFLRKSPEITVKQKSLVVLTGDRGTGKSTLIANWVKSFSFENQDIKMISHFVGSSGRSRDIAVFLRRCITEMREEYLKEDSSLEGIMKMTPDEDGPRNFKELSQCFHSAISLGPCVLVLDGVDELGASLGLTPQEVKTFKWLPMPLPSQCRVVFTTAPSDYSHTALHKRPDAQFFRVPLLGSSKLKHEHLEEHMQMHFEHLNRHHLTEIYESKMSGRPLFLSVMGTEMTAYSVYTNLGPYTELIRDVCSTIRDMYVRCLRRWSRDHSWRYAVLSVDQAEKESSDFIGWVPDVLRLLCVSRSGLTSKEILAMLEKIGYRENVRVTRFDWLMFRLCLGENLYEKQNQLLDFTHQHLREISEYVLLGAVKASTAEILSHAESSKKWKKMKKNFHQHLVQYFTSLPVSQRRTEELPWQYLMAGDFDGLKKFVTDPDNFMQLMDTDGSNPSNRHDLKWYWHYMVAEGSCPVQAYKDVLTELGLMEPEPVRPETPESSQSYEEPVMETKTSENELALKLSIPLFTPTSSQIPKIFTTPAYDEHKSVPEVESVKVTENQSKVTESVEKTAMNGQDDQVMDETEDVDTIFLTETRSDLTIGGQRSELASSVLGSASRIASFMWYVALFLQDLEKVEGAELVLLALNDRLLKSFPLGEDEQLIHAKTQENLGQICLDQGQIQQSEYWYKKALRTVMDMYDLEEESPIYQDLLALKGKVIGQIGYLRLEEGLLDDAEDLLQEALDIAELVGRIPARARILYHTGVLRIRQYDFLMAETSLRNALMLQERWYGKTHPLVADTLFSLARLMADVDNDKGYDKLAAQDAYRRTLGIREHYLGKDHLMVATVLFELGKLLQGEGGLAGKTECIGLLHRALDIRITQLGGDHIDTRAVRQFLNGLECNLKAVKHDVRTAERPYSSLSWRGTDLANMERKSRLQSGKSSTYGQSSRPSSQVSRPGSQFSRTASQVSRPISGRMELAAGRGMLAYLPASEKVMLESDRPRLLSQRQNVDQRLLVPRTDRSPVSPQSSPPKVEPSVSVEDTKKQITVELISGSGEEPPEFRQVEPLLDSYGYEAEKSSVKFSPPTGKIASTKKRQQYEHDVLLGRETPPERLFRRFGSPAGHPEPSTVSVRKDMSLKPKRPAGSARSVGSSMYTAVSNGTGVSAASSKTHKTSCDIPVTPHSIHISNTRTTTMGPHSSLKSLLGPRGPKDVSTQIHHKSAFYHVPGRYATVNKRFPPKRSQRTSEAKLLEKAIPPTAADPYKLFMSSDYRKNRPLRYEVSGAHTCGKAPNYYKRDRKNYVICEKCQKEAEANMIEELGEGDEDDGAFLSPTVNGLSPQGTSRVKQGGYFVEEPMRQEELSYPHPGTMVTFKDTIVLN